MNSNDLALRQFNWAKLTPVKIEKPDFSSSKNHTFLPGTEKKKTKRTGDKRSYKKHISGIPEQGDVPNYDQIDGIRVYDGTTTHSAEKYREKIKEYKNIIAKSSQMQIFDKLKHSTLTADGFIENISFNEQELLPNLSALSGEIVKIGCNFGERYNSDYTILRGGKKSNKGRKAKVAKPPKRKVQGTGKYFNTQLTFNILKPSAKRQFDKKKSDEKHIQAISLKEETYNVKLFRNGMFQVSGVEYANLGYMVPVLNNLCDYLKKNNFPNARAQYFRSVMRNYKTALLDSDLIIDLRKLEAAVNNEKNDTANTQRIIDIFSTIHPIIFNELKYYINGTNPMDIAEVRYNSERSLLVIKLYRPIIDDLEKKHTINVYVKGKINFDGSNSELEVIHMYYWLQHLMYKNRSEILLRKSKIETNEEEDFTDSESIYDDMGYYDPDDNFILH